MRWTLEIKLKAVKAEHPLEGDANQLSQTIVHVSFVPTAMSEQSTSTLFALLIATDGHAVLAKFVATQ